MQNKVQSFEDLHVYQKGRLLTNRIYELTRNSSFAKDFALADQIRRAAVSVMSNIAEGFERGTNAEFVQFLYIAKGSCGEVRSQLGVALDQKYVDRLSYQSAVEQCRLVSGMIGNLIAYLKDARYRGNKFKKTPLKSAREVVEELMEKVRQNKSEADGG